MHQEAILKAVEQLKNCPFKATSIKVEFEADLSREDRGFDDEDECYTNIMERLEDYGLAYNGDAIKPLVYAKFYNDGSVDSEFTFTLLLDDPANVFLLPKILEAWNGFCKEVIGDEDVDVTGAGMHIAIMNHPLGYYPGNISRSDVNHFENFKRSMTLLLPALYFLATHNKVSRALEYRRPMVLLGNDRHGYNKFNAIFYKDGALEYRIFDTCYDKPLAILDNIVVIANTMKFWTPEYLNPGLDKITKEIPFGNDDSYDLSRFYTRLEHIDLLNQGLAILKPSYRSIGWLKKEREFNINRRDLAHSQKRIRRDAELEYAEYSERFDWSVDKNRFYWVADAVNEIHSQQPRLSLAEARALAERQAEEKSQQQMSSKRSFAQYLNEKLRNSEHRSSGNFMLECY